MDETPTPTPDAAPAAEAPAPTPETPVPAPVADPVAESPALPVAESAPAPTPEEIAATRAELEATKTELATLKEAQAAAAKVQAELAADAALAPHAASFTAEGLATLKELFLTDPAKAQALLARPAAPVVAAPTIPPPKPMHDPGNASAEAPQADTAEKHQRAEALIKTVRSEGRFNDYWAAQEEARRRAPELFS